MIEPTWASEDNRVQLYLGDCMEILKAQQDRSVNIVVTDPPYGKDWSRGKNAVGTSNHLAVKRYISWDKKRVGKEYFDEMRRISKVQVFWGGNYYADYLPPSNCWLIWDKKGNLDNYIFADAELAWCSLNKVIRIFRLRSHGFIRDFDDERVHPTQKPVALMTWTIENYTDPSDTILDPFMGSGTTGVAALWLDRRFIGVEIDANYFEIAKRRIQDALTYPLLPGLQKQVLEQPILPI